MADLESVKKFLRDYDGPPMNIMEICGSHTASIAKNGIPSLLSRKIRLLSGPGCPVCVTPSSYIDRLIDLSGRDGTCVVTFGDLIRVPGSGGSLSSARGSGARVEMVYSPMDILPMAEKEPDTTFVFAAVGFETTTPVYALLLKEITEKKIRNIRLLTAIKTMPPVVRYLCGNGAPVGGFLAPGHVCVVAGYRDFEPIAEQYSIPFGVAGFSGRELLVALCGIVRNRGRGVVQNYYPMVVTRDGNTEAQALIREYFEEAPALWRGIGMIPASGRVIREKYREFDAGSYDLTEDLKANPACRCDQVLTGRLRPYECPLFGTGCTPMRPQGACMVSQEGSCFSYFESGRRD